MPNTKQLINRSLSIALTAQVCIVVTALTAHDGWAQNSPQSGCDGVECMEAVFDVGVVYQPPAGQYGITELMDAALAGDLTRVEAQLTAGAIVNARDYQGATALMRAVVNSDQAIVERLLAAGADPNIGDNRGYTPLSRAVQYDRAAVAATLLTHGADPNVYFGKSEPKRRSSSLLERAAVLGQTKVVRQMLERGADVQENGVVALNAALWKHHEDTAALLVEAGVDINAPTYDEQKHRYMQNGARVLHTAAQEGLESSVRLLLRFGADINDRNVHGQSALHYAVQNNHAKVVSILLAQGANVTGDDLAVALDAGDEPVARQLLDNLDLRALDTGELDSLIARADRTGDKKMLDRLFEARDMRAVAAPPGRLLFAQAGAQECKLFLWDLDKRDKELVFSAPGPCEQQFFFSRPAQSLYVVEDDVIQVVSLDASQSPAQSIPLPTAMIEANLAAVKKRVSGYHEGISTDWMTASVVQVGVLESGKLVFATHTSGPADGTYAFLYARSGDTWQEIDQVDCHRFDACRYEKVLGHSLTERPGHMTVWHPNIRRNPYFLEKSESRVVDSEYFSWNGSVVLEIDGLRTNLHYSKGESGHCADDCAYTSGISLELSGRTTIDIAKFSANNAIVDRYALVWSGRWPQCELIDLGTGKSVLGKLQVASWIH